MKLYSIEVNIVGTAYIKANDEADARKIAMKVKGFECRLAENSDFKVEGGKFHPGMPTMSLSPAATYWGPKASDPVELVEDWGPLAQQGQEPLGPVQDFWPRRAEMPKLSATKRSKGE